MMSFDDVVALARLRSDLRLIGLDGLPLAGKSTLASELAAALDSKVLAFDDFVREPADWAEAPSFPFQYMRYDAFLSAVKALATEGRCAYRPFDWDALRVGEAERSVELDRPVIVEGVSALHLDLAPLYDLRVWVESDAASVMEASIARGVGGLERQWRETFMPSVALYLATDPWKRADIVAVGRGA